MPNTDISAILVIGAGPIIIGQACEFDCSGTKTPFPCGEGLGMGVRR